MEGKELPDNLLAEIRGYGYDLIRIAPEMRAHAAADVTVVGPSGVTLGFLKLKDDGFYDFVPFDPIPDVVPGGPNESGLGHVGLLQWSSQPFAPRSTRWGCAASA